MITSLIIQQSKWNDHLTVDIQTYELVLMIRQAQIYSLGVREYTAGTSDKFNVGYGVYLDANNARYIFFADGNRNQRYDAGEAIETRTFVRGVTIDRFCGLSPVGVERCFPDAGNIDRLHISFFRPEPKANILLLNSGGNPSSSVNPPAIIYLKSPGNKQYKITVESNGQVSIAQI